MRQLAHISERWDRGYGHFTTRQNIQFNWPTLKTVPDILDALAEVGMHAIQTSGNCIRNVTADHFAGAAADEVADPRVTAELVRQWSTDHPEFAYLPRKFKFAVTGSANDRAVIRAHDIGLRLLKDDQGQLCHEVIVGGGLGRTPVVGEVLHPSLPAADLFPYIEAILRVYNLSGRRDNKYKARIKILKDRPGINPDTEVQINRYFTPPAFMSMPVDETALSLLQSEDEQFARWHRQNLSQHRDPNYSIVTISLKKPGETPGDASAAQMRAVADLAERYGHDEIRVSHEQNLVLPHVHRSYLPAVFEALSQHFSDSAYAESIGEMKIKISGCINACAHHHVGHIGILGLEKGGKENYQFTFGGDHTENMTLGERAGPGIAAEQVVPAIERVVKVYLKSRDNPDTGE